LGAVLAVLIALGCASTSAGAHQRKPRPLVLHPRFHVVGRWFLGADGPYVLLNGPGASGAEPGTPVTLVDEQAGTRTSVSYAGCRVDLMGGP
jgi:hypothetical protein